MSSDNPTAIIADDEAELRTYLRSLLAKAWPELKISAEVSNGRQAIDAIASTGPQIAFLDIRMPGLSGLQVAEQIARNCHIVFVTAYDEFAVMAFEKQAVDYLLKPVSLERIMQTTERLKKLVEEGTGPSPQLAKLAQELADKIATAPAPKYLQWLRVQRGDGIELIPMQDVIYLQAGDKYTAVKTRTRESLIRHRIRDLATQLDPDQFWQIHRSTIVNVSQIAKVSRSLTGRGVIRLKDCPETLTVSRRYLYLFKQM